MSENFSDLSKNIANDFIQSIVVIDDEAFKNSNTASTSTLANDISRAFAKKGKVCAIYAPETKSDLDSYQSIFQKVDVVVLDWLLGDIKNEESLNLEQDVEEELEAQYTLSLLKNFIEAGDGTLRLIIIYTAESTLLDIAQKIHNNFKEKLEIEKEDCSLSSVDKNLKIVVRSKLYGKQSQDALSVEYERLPDLVLEQFTSMTEGLLSDFALKALTVIRENTSRILTFFPKNLDPAYLGHRLLLPNTSDGKHLLIKLFGELISELLEDSQIDTSSWVEHWISSRNFDRVEFDLENTKFAIDQWPKFIRDLMSQNKKSEDELIGFLSNKIKTIGKKCSESDVDHGSKGGQAKRRDLKKIVKNAHFFFNGDKKSVLAFAKLTHYKSISVSNLKNSPRLTLGSVVKLCGKSEQSSVRGDDTDSAKEEFYVCIQQKCDSVRLLSEESRRFLFLPLSRGEGKLSIVVGDEVMNVDLKSYRLRTIKFHSNKKTGTVTAEMQDGKWIFESIYNEKLQWMFDLKETHALRILNQYCFALSRVGLDESEWLRRISDNQMS